MFREALCTEDNALFQIKSKKKIAVHLCRCAFVCVGGR